MSHPFRRALIVGSLLTLGALVSLFATSGIRARILDGYFVALPGVFVLALFRTIRGHAAGSPASRFDEALAGMRAQGPRTGALAMERDVELSQMNALHFHIRLRPILREITEYRLRLHYGVELEREPERARELVTSRLWQVVRPDLELPADRLARGPSLAAQRGLIEELERL